MYCGKNIHVENDKNNFVHLGVGAVHSEVNEIRITTGMRGWQARLRGPLDGDDPLVVDTLYAHHLHQPSTRPYNLNSYVNKLNYKDMESWKFLHEHLVQLLAKRAPGFFVEAGALDGEYLSNTLHLEKVYGWRGLLVEPNPVAYKHLLQKNRRAWSSNTCFAITPYPKEMILEVVDTHARTDTSRAMWAIRGSSFLTEAGGKDQRYQATHYDTTYASVQCFPFITYLKALNITKV
ncbi:hypothetical protein Pmani_009837 [Petrolisthes manimaculis]|uniref:Methyltransferase FkbM domain-containing protein n=1 Tax=Petrolisthes manimaculis TaxID=1843537 RepID=A0AAE1Q477_9EUCA|nr:hypothetical protein Pmani_009837 [Petrolisthes manimaculis]